MIAIAPDGTRYDFPDDATESEIDEFLKGQEIGPRTQTVEQEPFIPNIPPESQWPRPGVGPMGPANPQEILTASILTPGIEAAKAVGEIGLPQWLMQAGLETAISPRPGVAPFTPDVTELGGRAAIGAVRAVSEEINRAFSDLASEALQSYGIPAYPGVPMVQMEEYPITAGIPGTLQYAFRQLLPEYTQAADVWAGRTISGFTEPGMAAQLPLAPWKPIAAKFGAEIAASIPDTIQALAEAPTGPERLQAGLDLAASGLMGFGIGRQLSRPTLPRTLTTKEALNAAQERFITENRLRERAQTEARRVSPEAGGGYRVTAAEGLDPQTQVLLNQAIADNPGLGARIEVLKDHGPLDPENLRTFIAGMATIAPDGRIIPGKIRMSEAAFKGYIESLDPKTRRASVARTLNEEVIHSFVLPEEALRFFDTLTDIEKQARRELYLGESGLQITDVQVGHEALRQEMQRVLRLEPSEIVELRGIEKLNRYTVELIARIVSRIREWLETQGAKTGQQIKLDVLERLEGNVDRVANVLDQVEGVPPELRPWAINRSKAQINRDIINTTRLIGPRTAIAALGDRPEYLQTAVDTIVRQRQKFIENRHTVRDLGKSLLATLMSIQGTAVHLDTFKKAFPKFEGQPEFLAYAKDAAPMVRPEDAAGWWFTTEAGQKALNLLDNGIVRKADWRELINMRSLFGLKQMMERSFEQLGEHSRSRFNMTNLGDALAELKTLEKSPETILNFLAEFQGVKDFKKPFFGQFLGIGEYPTIDTVELTYWITGKGDIRLVEDAALQEIHRNWGEAQLYDNQKFVTERINQRFRQLQELGVAKDLPPEVAGAIIHHMLWDAVRGSKTPHEGLYKAIEAASINRRKTRAAAAEATAPLLEQATTMGKEEWRSFQETAPGKKGFFAATPDFISNFARDYLSQTTGPAFKEFVGKAKKHFGPMKPGALIDFWQNGLIERLETAQGADLLAIAKSLGLTKKLRLEDVSGAMKTIADPLPPEPPLKEGPQIPGVTRPEFVMASRAAFGPYTERFKPTEPPPGAKGKFTPEQRLRARVMGGIFEELMEQTKGKERWRRESVMPDEVADPKIETKQPIYQEFHPEQLKDPEYLGSMLVSDARGYGGEKVTRMEGGQKVTFSRKGWPVSVTKRLTAIQKYEGGKVYLVSTFRDGRRGPVLKDPMHPREEHVPLSSIMGRYRVIASVLLDEAVQDFKQEFKNVMAYEVEFGKPAYEASKRAERYEPPPGEEYEPPRARYDLTQPITEPEAASIMGHLFEEVGIVEGPQDVILAIDALREKPVGEVISAYSKLANEILNKHPEYTDQQIIEALAKQVYDNHIESASSQAFIRRTISQGPAPTGEAAELARQGLPETRATEVEPTRVPTPIEVEAGTPYREFLESEYGKKFAGKEEPMGPGEVQPTVPPVRTMVEGQEPAAINRLAKTGSQLWDKTSGEFIRWYSEWMNEKLRRVGGPVSKTLADVIDVIIDTERKRYGGLTPWLDPARREAGKPGPATKWMHSLNPVTDKAAISNAVGAIENTIPIPPFAKKLTNLARMANLKIGQMYAQANRLFRATGLFQRNLTGFGYDLIRTGTGEAWNAWAEGLAKANRTSVGIVKTFFKEWKEILDNPGVDDIAIENVNQDFHRKFPKAITHVKVDTMGVYLWQPVIHSDLFNYLETAARRASHATAFRDQFPNTPTGRKAFRKLMEAARKELSEPYQNNLTSLMRALQGHPSDSYQRVAILRPGEPAGEAVKFLNQTLGNFFARLVLTGQMFVQPGENIAGAVPVFLGYRNYLEGMARLAGERGFYQQLEMAGSVNRVMLDYSYDPASPVRSLFKISGNVLSKVFMEQFLNELQEASAAATAHVVRERIEAGKLSRWETLMLPRTFRAMGFSAQQAKQMLRGNKALLKQFEGKAASFLSSGNKAIAESSALGANRLVNSMFRFQSYPMMKANQLRKVLSGFSEAWSEGTAAEKAAATMLLTKFLIGGAMQGAITTGLTALAYEGLHGLGIRKNEAKDETLQFVLESFVATMSGPLYLVYRGAQYKGIPGIGEQALRTFFPYMIVQELWNFSWGAGQYRDLDAFDRIRKFVKMKIPGTKAITTGLSVLGLSMENKKLDAAMNAFYRWRLKEQGMGGKPPTLWEDESKEFRVQLKKAVEALKRADYEGYSEALNAAFDSRTKKGQLKAALAAKTILVNPKGRELTQEELEDLRQRIGSEYVDLLVDFDALLKRAAEKVKP